MPIRRNGTGLLPFTCLVNIQASEYRGNGNKAEMEADGGKGEAGKDDVQGTPAPHELLRSLLTPQRLQQTSAFAQDCTGTLEIGLLGGWKRWQHRLQFGQHGGREKRCVFLAAKGLDTGLFESGGFTGIEPFNGIAQFKHALLHRLRDASAV